MKLHFYHCLQPPSILSSLPRFTFLSFYISFLLPPPFSLQSSPHSFPALLCSSFFSVHQFGRTSFFMWTATGEQIHQEISSMSLNSFWVLSSPTCCYLEISSISSINSINFIDFFPIFTLVSSIFKSYRGNLMI